MTTLPEARKKGNLDQFIEEHDPKLEGDIAKALRVVEVMAKRPIARPRRTTIAAPSASGETGCRQSGEDDCRSSRRNMPARLRCDTTWPTARNAGSRSPVRTGPRTDVEGRPHLSGIASGTGLA